ncbi:dipeptidase 2-like isoform X2 [Astyanax mexicanus]|uniref:Dipeptidase n=1 Tax=Astyanax mexicanus TaxID=7994 RepID=A0A8T2KQN3_ASTMX|nr:dipeptidase 2-like isoform X2 [Astyanax mexicanus]
MFSIKRLDIFQLCLGSAFLLLLLLHGVQSSPSFSREAIKLMSNYPLIDGHNDLALRLRMFTNNKLSEIDLHNYNKTATDINRLKAAHVGGQLFAAYVLCTAQEKDAVRLTLEQIDLIRRICTEYSELELATTAEELRNTTKIACLISIEGGHSIDSSLPALRMFYQLGVRSMTLTHNCNTPWAKTSSAYYSYYKNEKRNLTEFGKAVVDEMNRLGMLIDLSHTSLGTASEVLKHSKAPVIFSHSSAYSICNHSRNVPDHLLHDLKKNGGLIMVNFHNSFIACQGKANISIVADHFDHLKRVVGAEHIGIGGDYDGAIGFPQGLEDVSKYPALIGELLERGWSKEKLADVLRLNFLRVFEKVEKIRDDLSNTHPSEVQIAFAEANNSCRLELKAPVIPGEMHNVRSGSPLASVSVLFWTLLPLYCYLLLS